MAAVWIIQDSGLPAQMNGRQIFKEEGFFEIFKKSVEITYQRVKNKKLEFDWSRPHLMVATITTWSPSEGETEADGLIDQIKAFRYEIKEVADHL